MLAKEAPKPHVSKYFKKRLNPHCQLVTDWGRKWCHFFNRTREQPSDYTVEEVASFLSEAFKKHFKEYGLEYAPSLKTPMCWMYKSVPLWVLVLLKDLEGKYIKRFSTLSNARGLAPTETRESRRPEIFQSRTRW